MQKQRILVVGSGMNDVYVNLDPRLNQFEADAAGVPWLDVGFDERTYTYFQETPVLGGAAVTLEVLAQQGLTAMLASGELALDEGRIRRRSGAQLSTRLVLCHEQKVAYLVPRERPNTVWRTPSEAVDWLFVDRSATLSEALVAQITRFLDLSQRTRLAVYLRAKAEPLAYQLARRADLVFVETVDVPKKLTPQATVCQILPEQICLQGECVHWDPSKAGFLTHLTTYSVIAATVLAGIVQEQPDREILLKAKANVETVHLDGVLSHEELAQEVAARKEEQVNLREIAACMVAPGKGILAADESGGSTEKHFAQFDIEDDEQHRRDYRNLLLSLPNLPKYVNAVILFDETTRQLADNGQNFVDYLTSKGIVPGVKVDQGLANFPNSEEQYTKGLEGLPERMRAYFKQGLRFAKWRSLFTVHPERGIPSDEAIQKVCADLATYAQICQEAGIVPIVEPEVLHEGAHSLEEAAEAQKRVLNALFVQLKAQNVDLAACVLKCSMVLAGSESEATPPEMVGQTTAAVLKECVPKEVAGVVFLSGGQSVEQATDNLRAVEQNGPFPWPVTFSFARALQWPALEIWRGDNQNNAAAQAAYEKRLIANCQALRGE